MRAAWPVLPSVFLPSAPLPPSALPAGILPAAAEERSSRRRLRDPNDVTGSDQASHAESGDQARSSMLPSPMLVIDVSAPSVVSAMYTSPNAVPMATQRPSGLASM